MDVRPSQGIDLAEFDQLKAQEKACAEDMQNRGIWVQMWRIAGQYANISIFDVGSHDTLHAILAALPLSPFMEISVTPLARHPSPIQDPQQRG
jgi:muconolactone D-isomerase